VILEAFAKYLHTADPELPAATVLARWLWERLSQPPETAVDQVLHCEIAIAIGKRGGKEILRFEGTGSGRAYVFNGQSDSGRKLLNSLHQYALSYEQQKWSRWVHKVKASDFNTRFNDG
jgi:hypothetical protein